MHREVKKKMKYKLYQNDWYWVVWYFMKNIKNTYHLVIALSYKGHMLTYWSGDLKTIGCCV